MALACDDLTIDVVSDLMEYRSRSGNVFGVHRSYIWKTIMSTDPVVWWKAYAATRKLSRVAAILLSLGASIAAVERTNKEFSVQKSQKRNRLTDERATKLTYVGYNLKTQRWAGASKKTTKHLDLMKKINVRHEDGTETVANMSGQDDTSNHQSAQPNSNTKNTASNEGHLQPSDTSLHDDEDDYDSTDQEGEFISKLVLLSFLAYVTSHHVTVLE